MKINIIKYALFTSCLVSALLFFVCMSSIVHAGVVIKPTPTTGLLAYWSFDSKTFNWGTNKVYDISGNSNTGTLVSMTTSGNQVAGKKGQALFFDGNVDSVSLASNPVSTVSNPSSACVWAKTNDVSASTGGFNQTIFNFSNDIDNGVHIGSTVNTGTFFASYRSGGTYYGGQSTSGIFTNNSWNHVCYVWNGTGVALYANGASVASTTNTDPPSTVNTIGARNDLGDGTWSGSIDDLRVYNRALSIAEIKQIYNSGALVLNSLQGNKTVVLQKTPSNFLTNGLVGYWSFDGSKINWASNTVTDSSGNGNTGTMINMSTTTSPAQGKIGQALSFDGVNDRINITDPVSGVLDFGTDSFSYGLWVYVTQNSGNYDMPLFKGGSSAVAAGYDMELGNSLWRANLSDGVDSVGFTFSAAPLLNQWVHLMTVVDRSVQRGYVYVNGVVVSSSGTDISSIDSVSNATNISISNATYPFNGKIDDVRIYNRALSATEIGQLYRLGR